MAVHSWSGATSESLFGNVKLGIHSTFEKARYKLQKNAGRLVSNDDNEDGGRMSKKLVRSNQYVSVTQHTDNTDIGLLPLEKETSCLQEVLEKQGLEREKKDRSKQQKKESPPYFKKTPPSNESIAFVNKSAIPSKKSEGCLLDLAPQISSHPPLASSARSISYIPTESAKQDDEVFQRSISVNHASSRSQVDFLDMSGVDLTDTLKPTPVHGSNGSSINSDPFAAIFDSMPIQTQQPAKPKVTLGHLAADQNSTWSPQFAPSTKPSQPSSFIPPPITVVTSNSGTTASVSISQQPAFTPKPTVTATSSQQSQKLNGNQKSTFDLFTEDPFGLHGFSRTGSSGSMMTKTMKEMRQDVLAKDLADDPDSLKVRQWIDDGKQGNIRALLSTLHEILWDDESRSKWEPIAIHQLVRPSDVRRAYKKAAIVCHPDKLVGTPYERISRLVFVELNEASSAFQKELEDSQRS